MSKFQSIKVIDGFSTTFRQWRADSHCKYLHGYALSVRITFEGKLDKNNWVFDFGGLQEEKEWLSFLLDHTTIVAKDDPELRQFEILYEKQIIQLRVLPAVGAEKLAEHILHELQGMIYKKTNKRVHIVSVEISENGKNSAIYYE